MAIVTGQPGPNQPGPVPSGPVQTSYAHSGPPQYGQPQYGQPQYGQPQYGQPQYNQPQYGQPQYNPYAAPRSAAYPAPPRKQRGRNAREAWQFLVAAFLGLIGTVLIAYQTTRGQAYDENALSTLEGAGTELNATLIQQLESVSTVTAAVTLLVLAFVALFRKRPRLALAAGVLVLGANLTTQAMKALLTRPDLGYGATESLPSGHTTLVFSLVLAAVLVSPRKVRWLVALVGAAVGGSIGLATVIAGWHRPSDVIAAFFVTAIWAAATTTLIAGDPRDNVRGFSGRFPAVLGAGLAAIGVIVYGFGWTAGDDATRIIPFTVILILLTAGLITGSYSRIVARTSN